MSDKEKELLEDELYEQVENEKEDNIDKKEEKILLSQDEIIKIYNNMEDDDNKEFAGELLKIIQQQNNIINQQHAETLNNKDLMLRERAELENFKRRVNEERIKERKYASQNLISDLLNVLENLDRAVSMNTEDDKLKNFLMGFKMINQQIFEILYADGLSDIKAIGETFNPEIHQSVSIEKDETKDSGIILEELQKGYKYKDRVIKPSMVKVNE